MHSLRERLFLSVGSIFLLIAILSYFVPKYFVHEDVRGATKNMNAVFSNYHQKVQKVTESWVTYRFLETAARLEAVIQTLPEKESNLWGYAATILSDVPQLAFVQVTEGKESVVISQENAKVHVPQWARDREGQLWINIEGTVFNTQALDNDNYLLVKAERDLPQGLQFTSFEREPNPISLRDSPPQMYQALKWQESVLIEKSNLIRILAAQHKEADGIMKTDSSFKRAGALLSRDIFSQTPFVKKPLQQTKPTVVFREEGPYVDLVRTIDKKDGFLAIGFSISTICKEVAWTLERPVLLFQNGKLLQAFGDEGEKIPTNHLDLTDEKVKWGETRYTPTDIQIVNLTISILTSESFLRTIEDLLHHLQNSLFAKISLNLLAISLGLLMVALILLARISKRITQPITQLAQVSEEIGNGKYEGLHLPNVEKRHDEVATLTYSFEKMVSSLHEREKMRGVLNKVVSKEIASQVLKGSIELGGEVRNLTMLFSDIRGFTPLSATLSPPFLITLLNAYMTRMCRIIDETHGVVDKFVGDEIMALYGAPQQLENHAEKAILAALWMLEDLKKWNLERKDHAPPITVGIGIHTGIAFAGNMGAENRLNYTVVGANVNLAARLCSAAEPMQILVSEDSYRSLLNPKKYPFQKLPPINLKGIDHPIEVYALSL